MKGVNHIEKPFTFRLDQQLCEKLSTIPTSEKSTIVRMALRAWFKIEPITPSDARQIAQELMQSIKERSER